MNANREDNHPNSVLEAMAAGVPVVATAVGGVRDFIRDGSSGFLCPADDAEALAARVIYVLQNPAVAARAASRARETCLEFIWPYDRPGSPGRVARGGGDGRGGTTISLTDDAKKGRPQGRPLVFPPPYLNIALTRPREAGETAASFRLKYCMRSLTISAT